MKTIKKQRPLSQESVHQIQSQSACLSKVYNLWILYVPAEKKNRDFFFFPRFARIRFPFCGKEKTPVLRARLKCVLYLFFCENYIILVPHKYLTLCKRRIKPNLNRLHVSWAIPWPVQTKKKKWKWFGLLRYKLRVR